MKKAHTFWAAFLVIALSVPVAAGAYTIDAPFDVTRDASSLVDKNQDQSEIDAGMASAIAGIDPVTVTLSPEDGDDDTTVYLQVPSLGEGLQLWTSDEGSWTDISGMDWPSGGISLSSTSDPVTIDIYPLASAEGEFDVEISLRNQSDNSEIASTTIGLHMMATSDPTPTDLPVSDGLVLYLDVGNGVSSDEGGVSGWTDMSASGNSLASAGNPQMVSAATPSGLSAIRFDGTDDRLERIHATDALTGLPLGNDDRTMFVVAKYDSAASWGGVAYGTGSSNQAFGLGVRPAGELVIQGYGNGNDLVSGTVGIGAGWLVQTGVLEGGTATLYKDGSQIAQFSHEYNTVPSKLIIGKEINNGNYVGMDLAAAIIYDRALSTSERESVESYLAGKYLATTTPDDEEPTDEEPTDEEPVDEGENGTTTEATIMFDNTATTSSFSLWIPDGSATTSLDFGTSSIQLQRPIWGMFFLSTSSVEMFAASGTTISSTSTWDGILSFPRIFQGTTTPAVAEGETANVDLAVSIGSDDARISFDMGVRLKFEDQAGKRIGFIENGSFTEITGICENDWQSVGDELPADGACKMDVDEDLVLWTKHFTTFVVYTTTAGTGVDGDDDDTEGEEETVTGGSQAFQGSGRSGTTRRTGAGAFLPPQTNQGQVLGASTYRFSANLSQGMRSTAVTELQNRLSDLGYFRATATGYFGPITFQAVKDYQAARGIPSTGFVGPLTRTELNSESSAAQTVSFQGNTIRDFVELLISIGVIGPDRAAAARVAVAN